MWRGRRRPRVLASRDACPTNLRPIVRSSGPAAQSVAHPLRHREAAFLARDTDDGRIECTRECQPNRCNRDLERDLSLRMTLVQGPAITTLTRDPNESRANRPRWIDFM